MMRSVEEEKGDCANWSRVISVEMKRNEKKNLIFGDGNHRIW